MNYEVKHVWSILLRLFHWSFALSIVALVVTGFYINSPWTNTNLEGSVAFPMAQMRYYHFLAGYFFTAAVAVRLFLYLFGNRQERIWDSLPITPRNIRSLKTTMGFYSYLSEKHDTRLGHNALAGMVYLVTIAVAVLQLIIGFYLLYPENASWQGLGNQIFGSQQQGRFVHHLLMWYFTLYSFIHVYIVIWNDVKTPEGLISSIFTGKKITHPDV